MPCDNTIKIRELNAKIVDLIRVATELEKKNIRLKEKLAKMRGKK